MKEYMYTGTDSLLVQLGYVQNFDKTYWYKSIDIPYGTAVLCIDNFTRKIDASSSNTTLEQELSGKIRMV